MPFLVITEAQRLIREAGGDFAAGDKLKNYWFTVCENLAIYADTWVQPTTISSFWKNGRGGEHLIKALKTAAEARKNKQDREANDYDARFISDLQKSYEIIKKDELYPREEIAALGGVISLLVAVAKRRKEISEEYTSESDRIAFLRNCCQVSRAIINEEEGEDHQ